LLRLLEPDSSSETIDPEEDDETNSSFDSPPRNSDDREPHDRLSVRRGRQYRDEKIKFEDETNLVMHDRGSEEEKEKDDMTPVE